MDPAPGDPGVSKGAPGLGCANRDLWGLCAPISIIVVYSKTATSYYFGAKE